MRSCWWRSPEQVYDALSYYYEHSDEIEQAIALNSDREYWQEWLLDAVTVDEMRNDVQWLSDFA